jgi:hypothetical protein
MSEIVQVKLTTRTSSGTLIRSPATLEYADGRIYFLKSPFSLKDEIKAMGGSRWHGYDEEDGRKIWSVEDSQRNRFQLGFLMGEDVYAWFNRDVIEHDYGPDAQWHADAANAASVRHGRSLPHVPLWREGRGDGRRQDALRTARDPEVGRSPLVVGWS